MSDKAKKSTRKRHEKRDTARLMFVTSDMTAAQIADALGIQAKTIGKWREDDSWDEERRIRNVSPVALIKRLNESINQILDDAKDDNGKPRALTSHESDTIAKLSKSIKNFRNSIEPQTVMEVLNGYTVWLSNIDLPLSQRIAEKNIAYVQMKLREHKDR